MENLDYKNDDIQRKYLKNMQSNQFVMIKNSLLELDKYFLEFKDRELRDREEKTKRETEELFCKPIIVSKDDMDKFEEQEMKKIRPIKKNGTIG